MHKIHWTRFPILLAIYTNIVTNRHGTCSYMTLYDSVASISFILSIFYISIYICSSCVKAFANLHLQKWWWWWWSRHLVADLLRTCRLCCGLATGKSPTCYGLATGKMV